MFVKTNPQSTRNANAGVKDNYYTNQNFPISPNLFHNPITSGLNSVKHASPLLNHTANFAGIK